jgi:hypothetical protein
MADSRTIKYITVAVWVVAAVVIAGLVFVRGPLPKVAPATTTGTLPIMYEFSSDS